MRAWYLRIAGGLIGFGVFKLWGWPGAAILAGITLIGFVTAKRP